MSSAILSWACTVAASVPSRVVVIEIVSRSCATSTVPLADSWTSLRTGAGTPAPGVWANAAVAATQSASARLAGRKIVMKCFSFWNLESPDFRQARVGHPHGATQGADGLCAARER